MLQELGLLPQVGQSRACGRGFRKWRTENESVRQTQQTSHRILEIRIRWIHHHDEHRGTPKLDHGVALDYHVAIVVQGCG